MNKLFNVEIPTSMRLIFSSEQDEIGELKYSLSQYPFLFINQRQPVVKAQLVATEKSGWLLQSQLNLLKETLTSDKGYLVYSTKLYIVSYDITEQKVFDFEPLIMTTNILETTYLKGVINILVWGEV